MPECIVSSIGLTFHVCACVFFSQYNIKKKDDPSTTTKNQQPSKINDLNTRMDNLNAKLEKTNGPEPQSEYD